MRLASPVWNTAVLKTGSDPFDVGKAAPTKVFSSRKLRKSKRHVHTRADPFLFVWNEQLYLFVEVQEVGQAGYIEAYRSTDLETWIPLGSILAIDKHVSYPQVFSSNHGIHMVPETASLNEVALYTFRRFPHDLEREAALLQGNYADPTIFEHDGLWWLFATSTSGLELFFSASLKGPFTPHPAGVISNAPDANRCGGRIIKRDGILYRPAQDGSGDYGGNLGLFRIEVLRPTEYREAPHVSRIFDRQFDWCENGGHHISLVEFQSSTVIAVDGKQADYMVNKVISLLMRFKR